MQREIVIDTGGLWFAKGAIVDVGGIHVIGPIWIGSVHDIPHIGDDMQLLLDCSAPLTKNRKTKTK